MLQGGSSLLHKAVKSYVLYEVQQTLVECLLLSYIGPSTSFELIFKTDLTRFN